MNHRKFFELAASKGITASEIYSSKKYSLSFELFHSEVSSYSTSESFSMSARGIYNDKFGVAITEKVDRFTPELLVNEIIANAKVIEKHDKALLFKGSEKYHKRNLYNKEIPAISIDQKMKNLYEIEAKLKKADPRIIEIETVSYSEDAVEVNLVNSYGLNLKSKSNYYVYAAAVVVKQGEEVKTGYKVLLSNDPKELDIDKFVKQVVEDATRKLGGTQCDSKKYPIVLNQKTAASFLEPYLESASAEEVQKHSSFFIGKLNQPVASKKVTILEQPLLKNCFFRYFDDEGVATTNKKIVEKGILKTYLYNLETAQREGKVTTGNGYRGGSKMGVSFVNPSIKPGRKSEAELLSKIKTGVYISSVAGLHSGLNPQSGNFSLQAEGFMIRDGKIAEPLSLITVAGNLLEMFMNVREVGNNPELQLSGISSPSLLIKNLAVSGK
ncbi:MAG: TldD/PmbA family protein [Erysipelotrichia bacterium]|jgi:PmbA protein|nr:TldD/PmbA family protein [Erysipelotrichia bacterium]